MLAIAATSGAGHPGASPKRPRARKVALRITGAKPLRFVGFRLAEGSSWAPWLVAWHELSLWRTDLKEIVVGIRVRRKAPGAPDVNLAEIFATMDAAAGWIEEFDPVADLALALPASDAARHVADATFLSAALCQQLDSLARQWRGLVGDILYQVEA